MIGKTGLHLLELIFYECLHGLIASQSQLIIEFSSAPIAVFRPLPEQSFIVSEERCTLHLRLVFKD